VRSFADALPVAPLTYQLRRDHLEFEALGFAKPGDSQAFSERLGGQRSLTIDSW
jgi:hypothetical protein